MKNSILSLQVKNKHEFLILKIASFENQLNQQMSKTFFVNRTTIDLQLNQLYISSLFTVIKKLTIKLKRMKIFETLQ